MKNFPLEKYKFFINGNKIIAVSRYAKKTVRGVAICHPDDNFNLEIGKQIAAARCNEKVAQKRYARAEKKFAEAEVKLAEAQTEYNRMKEYMNDSFIAMNEAAQSYDTMIAALVAKA